MTFATRKHRSILCSALILGAVLVGTSIAAGGPAPVELAFEQHDVVLGAATSQTVLTGFLLGGALADVAVVSTDERGDRRLRIFALAHGGWEPKLDRALGPDVLFVDVAALHGRDRLITFENGRVLGLDPATGAEGELVAVPSSHDPPPGEAVPHVDITHDVNGDGRDDLVVPDVDGFWLYVQREDGAFADPLKLRRSARGDGPYGVDGYRHDPWSRSLIHEVDTNRDGRRDLAFWNDDHFRVHLQDEQGLFSAEAVTFTTDVAFDSDDPASLAAPDGVRGRRMDGGVQGSVTGRVLHTLSDMNGDGVADLVVFSLEGGSLLRMRSLYEVHFGAPAPDGGTVFAAEAGAVIRSEGIPFGLGQHDLDRDGQVDVVFTTFDPGPFKILGAFVTRSVGLDLEFSRMEDGVYPGKPSTVRKTRSASFGKSGEKAAQLPSVLIGDVNGDGRSDLLLGRGGKELRLFPGVPGPDLFARNPQKVAVVMPGEEFSWLVDLDRDGRQDVLLHHPSATEPHRLTMLLAR